MIEITDFFKLDIEQKKALIELLLKDSNTTEWERKTYGDLKLNHKIIKHDSAPKYGPSNNQSRIRYEVLDNKKFNEGNYATIYKTLCTLSIDKSGLLQVKNRHFDGSRLVKYQEYKSHYKETKEVELTRMVKESKFMSLHSFFHSKPISIGKKGSYIVMRELQTAALDTWINDNELTVRGRYQLSQALLKALQEQIQDKGWVHFDIKPENIIVKKCQEGFEAFIIDYGFITYEKEINHSLKRGTHLYSAPECYSVKTIKSKSADVYSMGRVLMVLWGHRVNTDKIKSYEDEARAPCYKSLFKTLTPQPTHQYELCRLFKQMCEPDSLKRISLSEAISELELLKNIREYDENSMFLF